MQRNLKIYKSIKFTIRHTQDEQKLSWKVFKENLLASTPLNSSPNFMQIKCKKKIYENCFVSISVSYVKDQKEIVLPNNCI